MSGATAEPHIRGEKVSLQRFTEADITDRYIGWLNDPLTMRLSNQRFVQHNRQSSLRYLQSFTNSPNLFLSVRDKTSGLTLGTMTAYIAPHHGTADMGILIGERSVWGQGFGFDAWITLMCWLLEVRSQRKITAGALAGNTAMLQLMRKSGMAQDGTRRQQEIVEGAPQDIMYFARFRDA